MEVFTEEWARACCERLNEREKYRQAGATWEWPVVLVMTPDPVLGLHEERAVHLDLRQGTCRDARAATAQDREDAPYVLEAGPGAWREIMAGRVDPVAALMQGKLRLGRGSLFVLARYTEAAREMVAAAGEVEAVFPDEAGGSA